jgi:very-short-patch-repair endonuclease
MRTVLRTSEAVALHGRGKVRHAIAAGGWQSPCRGVVVTHNGNLSKDELDLVALHLCAPGSALGGLTSLTYDGFSGFEQPDTLVVLPEGADRPRKRPALVTHWSTELTDRDVHPFKEPRRTRPARSLIDAASWCDSDRFARTIIIAGMQQGLANARLMHQSIERRGTCKRRGLIRESVLDADGGIQSLPERDFDEIRLGERLPRPTRQVRVKGPDGHYFLDATWDEVNLTVEVHGAPHREIIQWDADVRRGNEVAIDGRRQLVFTSYAIRHEKAVVADQLLRMFWARGWRAA